MSHQIHFLPLPFQLTRTSDWLGVLLMKVPVSTVFCSGEFISDTEAYKRCWEIKAGHSGTCYIFRNRSRDVKRLSNIQLLNLMFDCSFLFSIVLHSNLELLMCCNEARRQTVISTLHYPHYLLHNCLSTLLQPGWTRCCLHCGQWSCREEETSQLSRCQVITAYATVAERMIKWPDRGEVTFAVCVLTGIASSSSGKKFSFSTDGEKVSDYEMKLMDLDTEHLGIPVCKFFDTPFTSVYWGQNESVVA